MLTGLVYSS